MSKFVALVSGLMNYCLEAWNLLLMRSAPINCYPHLVYKNKNTHIHIHIPTYIRLIYAYMYIWACPGNLAKRNRLFGGSGQIINTVAKECVGMYNFWAHPLTLPVGAHTERNRNA